MQRSDGIHPFRSAITNLARIAPLALAAMLPGTAAAQVFDCPATFSANTAEDVLYFINEPVGIELEFGVGTISGGNYLDIDQFTYYLDCQPGESFPDCTSAGNTVEFIGNVVSDCTDEDGATITFDAQESGGVVTFVPQNPPSETIRIPANTSCSVTFDVMVTGVSGDNEEKEIFELTGFVDSDAQCDNEVSAGLGSQVIFSLSAARTVFWVTKDFSDDNSLPVDVHLVCNTGLPLIQEFSITDPASGGQWPIVGFVVREYQFGELDCHVFEDPIPNGYSPSYTAGADDGVGDVSDDGEGCYFDNVVNGAFTCEIGNDADPGRFTITKYWEVDGAVGTEVVETARVDISCDSAILSVDGVLLQYQTNSVSVDLTGDGDSVTVEVDTADGPANCSATEQTNQSGVESTDDCGTRVIPAGGSSSCMFTNTVFFEGIPTLNRYGIAVMALLMLGVGMVGYRKFTV